MSFDHSHYVPCLRWKMGEYQAVLRLHDTTKRMLTPLIQIPEIGYDFKEKRPKSTLDEHLEGFVLKKIYKKWWGGMKKKPTGINNDQSHRLLEDLETIALTLRLLNQNIESFGRDIRGMINGNNKKRGG